MGIAILGVRWSWRWKVESQYIKTKEDLDKVVEEDMMKLNIMELMAENRQQWRQLISCPTPGVEN